MYYTMFSRSLYLLEGDPFKYLLGNLLSDPS